MVTDGRKGKFATNTWRDVHLPTGHFYRQFAMRSSTFALFGIICAFAYDLEDPAADHYSKGIELDATGDIDGSIASFRLPF